MRQRLARGAEQSYRYGDHQIVMAARAMQSLGVYELNSPPEDTDLPAKDHLRRLFVAALNEQTDSSWEDVLDYCSTLSVSERQELSLEPDVQHYVHRSLRYAENSVTHTHLVESLSGLLPHAVELGRRQGGHTCHNLSLTIDRPRVKRRNRARKRVVSLDSGLAKLLTYSPTQIAATFRGPSLQLSDLIPAASVVSHEITQESKTALSPSHHLHKLHLSPTSPHHQQHQVECKPVLSPVYHSEPDSRRTHFGKAARRAKNTAVESKLHTAYDVIEAFATGSLQAGAESVYLNSHTGSPWNPYNLTVVPSTRANPEHYLISKFGILHVDPGGSSDLQNFAEWLHEAGLFSLCQQIPFFRQFLIRKMFRCWHQNVCCRQFVRLSAEVERVGLRFFPEFHPAVDKIHRLNTELLNYQTLSLTPLGGYSAESLEKTSEETEAKTHRLLQRYFKYCRRVVSEAVRATQKEAEKLEEEKKHQPFVSDSPISVQVAQHAELETRLGVARYRASRLGSFVCLAEQMMAACLLQVARQSAQQWVREILHLNSDDSGNSSTGSLDSDDRATSITEDQSDRSRSEDALMVVELRIAENGGVVIQPDTEKIVQLLWAPLNSIIQLLSTVCTTATAVAADPHPQLATAGERARDGPVKAVTVSGRVCKPLLQILKGITMGGSGSGSVPESSRARSRLEEVQVQVCSEVRAREEYSTTNSSLIPQNMLRKLQHDPVLQDLSDDLRETLDGLSSELSAVCQHYMWLDHTQSLVDKCKREKMSDMTAETFETLLGELHTALSRLSVLPPLLTTSHSLVTISTAHLVSHLEPQLQQSVSRLHTSLATQALEVATQLLRAAQQHTQVLSEKRYDLEGFVQYAHSLRESQSFHTSKAANMQRVADIHNTLRKYSISISPEARETLQRLQGVWGDFEVALLDGEEFVKKQTPIKAQGLQDSILGLEEQLEQWLESVSGGEFTDPTASPQSLLLRLEATQEEMSAVRSRLMELSKWEEAITGRHHNLSRIFHCFDVLYARQELWKYRRQFDSCDYEWSRVPFKKLDMAYVEQKVCEWWGVCDKLGRKLPPTDPVLVHWRESVERMHTNMPTLQLLASRDIQTSHWHTIFAGFNEQYDPHQTYTLHYFLDREPCKLSDLIIEVHTLASQQSRLREKFRAMEKQWEAKSIELSQTTADRYSFCLPPVGGGSHRHTTITFQDSPEVSGSHGSEADRDQLQMVERGGDLEREIESAVLELGVTLSSPHLGQLKKKVELLRCSLRQVSELFHLLLQCQSQWQDLLDLFLHMKPSSRKSSGLPQLQSASKHLMEVMDSIQGDPRLFSLLSKGRGRKGVRDLQGPELRKKLKTVIHCLEKVVTKLHSRLDEAVCQWPRLGYLTEREQLKAVSCRGNPLPIIPLISRVFPSIMTLHYTETSFSSDTHQGYQVTGVEGELGEHLSLVLPLPLEKKSAVDWLAGLEQAVRFTLSSRLTECLDTLPHTLIGQPLTSDGVPEVMQWLKDNVEQNVLLALDIHWSQELLKSDTTHLQPICSQLRMSLENSVQLLLRQKQAQQEDQQKFLLLLHILRSIIILLRRKVDFAQSLLTADDPLSLWQSHIHYTTASALPADSTASSADISRTNSVLSPAEPLTQQPSPHPPSSPAAGHTFSAGRSPMHMSPPTPCFVHAGGSSVAYGFEYCGPAQHIVMTPSMESGVAAIVSALAQHSFPLVNGESDSATIREAAKVLGRHHYQHTCTHLMTAASILSLLHTALSSGSILSLAHPHHLTIPSQLKLRHYLLTLQPALSVCFTQQHSPTQPPDENGRSPCTPSGCPSRIALSRLDWYETLSLPTHPQLSSSLEHMGKTLIANANFGCCVILTKHQSSKLDDSRLTGITCLEPDKRLTVEVLFLSHGFSSAYHLSTLLVGLSHQLQTHLGVVERRPQFNLPWLKRAVDLAAHLLHNSSDCDSESTLELEVTSRAVLELTAPSLVLPRETNTLEYLVSHHLLGGGEVESRERWEENLVKAVEDELRERHLQILPQVTNKVLQLHQSLEQHRCTILLGPRKCGITTCYTTLASAYVHMGRAPTGISVINPAAYSWEQLFGGYCTDEEGREVWADGVLSRLLLHLEVSQKTHWVVLDGPLSHTLLDTINTLISDDGLCLPGMERVKIPQNCRLLLKPGPLSHLSPALVSSCGLLHWSTDTLTHDMLVDSWLDRAPTQHDLTGMSISYLANVLQTMVPESLQFLDSVCSKHYGHQYTSQAEHRAPGVAETHTILTLLSAMLERNCPTREGTTLYGSRSSSSLRSSSFAGSITSSRCGSAASRVSSVAEFPDQLPPLTGDHPTPDRGLSEMEFSFSHSNLDSVETQTLCILTFAFIWSIGAYIPFSEVDSFHEFAMGQINDLPMSVSFPEEGSVFDYYLDLQTYKFELWSNRKGRLAPRSNGYIPTPELSRLAYVAEVYLSYGQNVLLLGNRGSGKTSLVESLLQSNLSLTRFPISRSLTATQLHTQLCNKISEVSRVDKMRWGSRKIGIPGQNCLFFVDDLHLSYRDDPHNDNSPSITQLVSLVSHHGCLFTYPEDSLCYMNNVQFLSTSLPGHLYSHLTHLLGSFHPLPLFPLSDQGLHTIFSTSVQLWFKRFPSAAIGEPETLSKALSVAAVATFRSVCGRLCPSPSHPHWLISLHHLMDVFKGLLLMPLDTKTSTIPQFNLLNRRVTPSTAARSSSRRSTEKSARKSSSVTPTHSRRGTARPKPSVHLPPVKKESSLRSKIKSELRGKKQQKQQRQQQQHDSSEVQATIHRLVRLWCHENTRVYADRMTESKDCAWFVRLLETCVKFCFCGVRFEKASPPTRGGRPVRRGRGVSVATQSVGLNMTTLLADGVRADVLESLMPKSAAGGPEQVETSGELIPLNQVITRGEDVTALIFCKMPSVRPSSAMSELSSVDEETHSSDDEADDPKDTATESVYQELGDGQVLEAVEQHIQRYSAHCARQAQESIAPAPELVLFQQAMEHATRLCRAMLIPGCHCLLLGVGGSGRKSLCRLVAYMMRAQLFEMEAGGMKAGMEVVKKACMSAATASTALLVHSAGQTKDTHMWSCLSQIMSEGTCSGLFTSTELIRLQNVLRKDHLKKAVTPQAIARLVHRNLHVLVIWDIDRSSHSPIVPAASINGTPKYDPGSEDIFSMLCSCCSVVDHYQPWGQRELSEVAQKWWREKTLSLQQGWITSESQLEALADLATHIHLSTLSVLEQHSKHLPPSPSFYTNLLTLAHSIAVTLTEKDKGREESVCLALGKLERGEEGKRVMQRELSDLQSQLRDVQAQLDERERNIEACQQRYKSASQEWSEAKRTISSKTEDVRILQSTVAEKMDQVSSLLSSAMEALLSITKNDVLEVMSYREPPPSATPVFNSLCMLFDRPQTWEDCKLLLLSPNFFESLRFFDKDHISRHKLRELRAMLQSPLWRAHSLQHTSRAVSSLALWVAALLDYHHARDVVKPSQEQLSIAEGILTKAELTLVAKQKIMIETKVEFKRAQKERGGISKEKTVIETKITAVERRLSDADRLLSSLSPWKSRWEQEKAAITTRTLSAPGHAVLTAASVVYLPRVPADSHRSLWQSWLGYCAGRVAMGSILDDSSPQQQSSSHQIRVHTHPEFSPKTLLSLEEERARWNHYASFPDSVALDRCIAARKSLEVGFIPPPLVLDPHRLFQSYSHELELHGSLQHSTADETLLTPSRQPASCVEVVRSSTSGWADTVCELEETRGKPVVLILDKVPSASEGKVLVSLLRRRRESWDTNQPPQEMFRLYLVLEGKVGKAPSPVLAAVGLRLLDLTVVDMELSGRALEFHLLKFILRIDHPEYAARHRALLVDQTFYENQIDSSKERVITSVLESDNLLECPEIKELAEEGLEIEATALENIRDTEKALSRSRSLVDNYRPLSLYSALVFTEAERLCSKFCYHSMSLVSYQEMVAALLARHKHGRPPEDPAGCQEHVLQLQMSLLQELQSRLKWRMYCRHHRLLPLLVNCAQMLPNGEISSQDWRALEEDPESLARQIVSSEYTTRPTAEDSIDHVLSTKKLSTPVVCLTHREGDEERVEQILRESARERDIDFHQIELVNDADRELILAELASCERGWVVVTYSHLLKDPQSTWRLLTEVMEKTQLQLWLTVPWSLNDLSWPSIVLTDHTSREYSTEMLADLREVVHDCTPPHHKE